MTWTNKETSTMFHHGKENRLSSSEIINRFDLL